MYIPSCELIMLTTYLAACESTSKNMIQTWPAGKPQNFPALSKPKFGQIRRTLGVAPDFALTFLTTDSNIEGLTLA